MRQQQGSGAVSGTVEQSKDPARDSAIATTVLRASVRSRCQQAGMAFAAMILNTGFCALLLGRGINEGQLALILLASTALLLVRFIIATRALRTLPTADSAQLERSDRQFRMLSLASQAVTGALIWIVWGAYDELAAYMMTLLICLYATGTMVNLAHDYRSFRLSIPLLMAQPTIFWLLGGADGIAIAVILIGLTLLMISSVRNSQRIFEDSVRIRFEKDDLLRQLEQEKETAVRALQQAEAANRSKSFFMAAASHDLRQPMYAATLLADTMALLSLPEDAKQLLDQQTRALKAAGGLFDNLLDLARFESGTIEPSFGSVSVRELLREIDAEFSVPCRAKALELVIEPIDFVARSDYDLLDRMLRNLVSNAVRYTHRGEVRITCAAIDNDLLLTIADTGIGIAPQDQERVFKEFVQLHNPARSRDKGVGLGLAIVRHIALLLGHSIAVDSCPGQGTRMTIRLPRAESAALEPERSAVVPATDLTGRSVWIVEDDTAVREALRAYFSKCGCQCATASSRGEIEELQRTDRSLPDYVVIDDMLGAQESGLEVARWLADQMSPRRILLMTGNSDPHRWQELEAGGFEVLLKPVHGAALNEWVQRSDAEARR